PRMAHEQVPERDTELPRHGHVGSTVLFLRMNPEGKWGQVVGNLVSEWVQMAGLVFPTKRLVEIGSKESR
ncbi:MAG: hypothetical protein M3Y80_08585, partial [Verrucomicrobiota bacterium]|nr:hypothetical protein [Verrucomicrobiota bacterium]